jgi:alpha-ribazole phosphatase
MAERKTLMLMRHGSTGHAFHGRFVGQTDIPVASEGLEQVEAMASYVCGKKPDRCFCSPLLRTRQTAAVVSRAVGLSVEEVADLREIDFGRWEKMTFAEISASEPAPLIDRWAAWDEDFSFPGGESLRDFVERVRRAAKLITESAASRILAVTHGGVIRAMICHLLGLPESQYLLFDIKPASLTTIEIFDGRGVLTELVNPPQAPVK